MRALPGPGSGDLGPRPRGRDARPPAPLPPPPHGPVGRRRPAPIARRARRRRAARATVVPAAVRSCRRGHGVEARRRGAAAGALVGDGQGVGRARRGRRRRDGRAGRGPWRDRPAPRRARSTPGSAARVVDALGPIWPRSLDRRGWSATSARRGWSRPDDDPQALILSGRFGKGHDTVAEAYRRRAGPARRRVRDRRRDRPARQVRRRGRRLGLPDPALGPRRSTTRLHFSQLRSGGRLARWMDRARST